jgi:hypothetical protein
MKRHEHISRLIFSSLILLLLLISATAVMAQHPSYKARVRLYMVEPLSRWNDYYYQPYHMGFLAFAYDTVITVNYLDSLKRTITWNGATAGYGDIQQNNIMAIAAVFSDDSTLQYSSGDVTRPYYAHYVDAAAAATTTQHWDNSTDGGYSHTVFTEVGTGIWCQYCPNTNAAMHAIYSSADYNFFYAEMIEDNNLVARNRVRVDYNQKSFPTTYFDGGNQVLVGGETTTGPYTTLMDLAGARDIHDFALSVSMTWMGSATVQIQLDLKDMDVVNSAATTPSAPVVKDMGGTNENITITATSTDPDGDQLYYRFFWKTGDTSTWQGPFNSGEICSVKHKWTDSVITPVKVRTRDFFGILSDWSSPKQIIIRTYIAGDANNSDNLNLLDASYIINALYRGGPRPIPEAAGDVNGNNAINLLDVSYLINFLYRGGPDPKFQP